MSRLYVFGIGGTGSRVIKALTLLLGAGMRFKSSYEVIPILIDPDIKNGDLIRTKGILNSYQKIRNSIADFEPQGNRFFSTQIRSLNEIAGGNEEEFAFRIEGMDTGREGTFQEFVGYSHLKRNHLALLELLFSQSNLELNMRHGFLGNPNVGSVVLNGLWQTDEFTKLNTFGEGDRIFIVSSIFGGTGAAGFPLLVKNLRSETNENVKNEHLRNALIGAISVLPYFEVHQEEETGENGEEIKIDGFTFLTKTKAALNYYEHTLGGKEINAFYCIGDRRVPNYHYCEGATEQINRAHFIELAAALAIVDFANQKEDEIRDNPTFREFGLADDPEDNPIEFRHLGRNTLDCLQKPLIQYQLFVAYLEREFESDIRKGRQPYVKQTKIDEDFFDRNEFFRIYLRAFNSEFQKWLREMSENVRPFAPFNFKFVENGAYFKIVRGLNPKRTSFSSDANQFRNGLNKYDRKVDQKLPVERRFIELFYRTIKDTVAFRLDV